MNIVIKAETTPEELNKITTKDLVVLSGTIGREILNAIPQFVIDVFIAPDATQATVQGLPPHIKYVYFHRNSLFERFLALPSHVVGVGFKRLLVTDIQVLNAVPKGKALILNSTLAEFVSLIPANIDTICIHGSSPTNVFAQLPAHIKTVRLAEGADCSVLQLLPPSVNNVVIERTPMAGILDSISQQYVMLQTLQAENERLRAQLDLYKTPSSGYVGTFFPQEGEADTPTRLPSGISSQPVEPATEDAKPAAAQRKSQRIQAQQKKNRIEEERTTPYATIGLGKRRSK